jgi:predicted enzyme related to lactoylglutathione lyase
MGQPVVHFEVSGPDAGALQSFYADLFDWKINADNPMNYGMVEAEEGGIAGGVGPNPPGAENHLTFYVEVDDLQAALDRAEQLGGKPATPPMDVPGGPSIAHFVDPAGNFVGLVKGM